ncbi:MAG: DNA-processing protein DprA [Candidatus Midichloriaceae bacterium]
MLKTYGDPETALQNIDFLAKKGGFSGEKLIAPKQIIEKEIEETKKYGADIILACEQNYPNSLLHIPDFPPVIVTKGNAQLLNTPIFAIIVARNSSINGNKLSFEFAKEISDAGLTNVSGLAKGIDSFAHKGSLNNGTIGVIAGGISHIYPKENSNLYEEIYDKGLVVTEQPINSSVLAQHFPQRNRMIAGLASGVLVVEATKKSGTLITSRFALDYNREVYAIPGSPLDSKSQGTNELLKQGANLALAPKDIIQDVDRFIKENNAFVYDNNEKFTGNHMKKLPSESELALFRQKLFNSLSHSPIEIDDIVEQLEIPINILSYLLLELELAGKISRLSNNKIYLIS